MEKVCDWHMSMCHGLIFLNFFGVYNAFKNISDRHILMCDGLSFIISPIVDLEFVAILFKTSLETQDP